MADKLDIDRQLLQQVQIRMTEKVERNKKKYTRKKKHKNKEKW